MNLKRYLLGKLSAHYEHNWRRSWGFFRVNRYWSGRLVYLSIGPINFGLDCRKDWVADMITGDPA